MKTNRVEIHDIEPLQTLVRGRVALLGDAGHTTAPDLGQGGCQAVEDALVLSTYLQTTPDPIWHCRPNRSLSRTTASFSLVV